MSERDDILEQNLARLFERAYRPVRPSPEFRARLAHRLERASSQERTGQERKFAPRLLAAAAIVFVFAVGYVAWRSTNASGATPAEIVARGCVAVKLDSEDGWREIDAFHAQHGLDSGPSLGLTIHTPPELSFRIRDGSSAAVTVGASSHALIDIRSGLNHLVELRTGSVRIDNLAARDEWLLLGPRAQNVALPRGALSARVASCNPPQAGACLFVVLENGEAAAFAGGYSLQVGVEVALYEGRVLSASIGLADPSVASGRTSVTVETQPAAEVPPVPAQGDGSARITGTIVRTERDAVIGPYTVTLLRKQRLPSVATPKPYSFDGAERFSIHPVKPGTYDVYVERKGHAVWRALGAEIKADATHDLTVESAPSTSLRGRVVADKTGAPIENALVIVEDDVPAQVIQFDADASAWSAAARTDANGEFEMGSVSGGAHMLRATATGFGATWSTRMAFDPAKPIELRLATPGRLAGRVAHEDGRAWHGAIVIASFMRTEGGFDRFSFGMGLADEDGQYSISDLPAGDYVLLNVLDTTPGRSSVASRQVHVNAGATTTANLPDTLDGARLYGRVLDQGGAALGGLDVTLQPRGVADDSNWRSVRSDAEGRFSFAGLPGAVYEVFVGESLGERFAWAEAITVPEAGDFEHDIRLGAGSIRGRATSKEGLIAGGFVMLQRAERDGFVFAGRVLTDARGVFTFERLQPATYRVVVFPAQKGLAPGESTDLWIARNGPPVECEIAIERGAALTVIVRDASGTALAGIALDFVDGAGHAFSFRANDVTGADGRYAIDGLAAGRWVVSARAPGGAAITQNIELIVGDERELVLTLP